MLPPADESLASLAPPTAGRLGRLPTARLELTPIDTSALDALASIFAKEEVWRYPFGRGFRPDETAAFVDAQVHHWDVLGFGLWLTTVRDGDVPIGFVGLSVPTFLPEVLPAVEVGWRLDPDAWGSGYATEAATAALGAAFETLKLHQVISLPQIDNPSSVKVAERIGMHLDHVTTAPPSDRRGAVEVAVMVMTHQTWDERPAPHRS